MSLQKGDKAPLFHLYNSEKKQINLEDYAGKNVVILFFPLAFTSTCTAELCSVRDDISQYGSLNAILYAAKNNVTMEGSTLYVTLSPCIACARVIYTTGIKKVFYLNSYAEFKKMDVDEGVEFLKKFGVEVVKFSKQ